MKTKLDKTSSILIALEQFITTPNYLTHYILFNAINKDIANVLQNRTKINSYLSEYSKNGNKISKEIEHLIHSIFNIINLKIGKDIKHNTQQLMNRLEPLEIEKIQHPDLIWNILALSFVNKSENAEPELPKQWKILIPAYDRKTYDQRRGYCVGKALLANSANAESWIHLAKLLHRNQLALSDLPQQLISSFTGTPHPQHYARFCCEQALANKCTSEMIEVASTLITQIQYYLSPIKLTLQSSSMNPTNTNVANQTMILETLKKNITIATKIDDIFNVNRTTIKQAKEAIDSVQTLLTLLNLFNKRAMRRPFLYALFNHSDKQTQSNSWKITFDEDYIKKIIITKNHFEQIINTLPSATMSYDLQSGARNKFLKSKHIQSLCKDEPTAPSIMDTELRNVQMGNAYTRNAQGINIPIPQPVNPTNRGNPVNPAQVRSTMFSHTPVLFLGYLPTQFLNTATIQNQSPQTPLFQQGSPSLNTANAPGTLFANTSMPNSIRTPTPATPALSATIDLTEEDLLDLQKQDMEIETTKRARETDESEELAAKRFKP